MMSLDKVGRQVKQMLYPLVEACLKRGLPPSWVRYESLLEETLDEYFIRCRYEGRPDAVELEIIHPEALATNPLPLNVKSRDVLPNDQGWWGYSFWDVPSRKSAKTVIARLSDCVIVPHTDPRTNEFWVAILNKDRRALRLREMKFGDRHARVMRSSRPSRRLKRATWILERVYHNHSHWLTAHLPKLLLLNERNDLSDVYLPERRTEVMDSSIRMIGLDPDAFPTFDGNHTLLVDELTLVETDRFRPELLRSVRSAISNLAPSPVRRLYISRAKADRRQLTNEEEIWPLLREAGFSRVFMEELQFEEQVEIMRQTATVIAPHGAGLTNILFCAPGTQVIEIADLSFPNPNFYALASAMGHRYRIIPATSVGGGHPLSRNMEVAPSAVNDTLVQLDGDKGSSGFGRS